MTRMAWGAGFSTEAADGTVLDAWFRWLGWGELGEEAPEEVDVALADRLPQRRAVVHGQCAQRDARPDTGHT